MKHPFKLSISFIWLITALAVFFLAEGFYLKDEFYRSIFLSMGLVLSFVIWFIVFFDILHYPVHNKTFWVISIFVLPYITLIVYLFRRNKLIIYGEKLAGKKNENAQ